MQHQKNRKPDNYYIDLYDRSTIESLKKLEEKEKEGQAKGHSEYFSAHRNFIDTGVFHARRKKETIEQWIRKDEREDFLVETTPIPQNINCNKCAAGMRFERFICIYENPPILFDFVCPSKSCKKRKLVYPNGQEYYVHKTEPLCSTCGSILKTTVKKTKKKTSIVTTCPKCGIISTDHYEINDDPIDEKDRKKYCTDFINRNTFWEDLKKLGELFMTIKEGISDNEEKEKIGFHNIDILTVPQLEQKLSALFNSLAYQKFQLGTPSLGKYLTITFSAEDPTTRTKQESSKIILKKLVACVLPTNWRLLNQEVSYRLGILTGTLKAYETDEDLKKIALQILKSKSK
jgi:hypothetical protein